MSYAYPAFFPLRRNLSATIIFWQNSFIFLHGMKRSFPPLGVKEPRNWSVHYLMELDGVSSKITSTTPSALSVTQTTSTTQTGEGETNTLDQKAALESTLLVLPKSISD